MYSSGPNKRVHTPIYFRRKIPPHMALLGTTCLLIFQRKSKKNFPQKDPDHECYSVYSYYLFSKKEFNLY